MPRTVAHLIYDFLAPVQPEDCRHASLGLLADALKATGPVIHEGQIVTSKIDGYDYTIDFDLSRAAKEYATEDVNGVAVINREKIPPDEELSVAWGLPTAASFTLPLANGASDKHDVT